MKEPSYGCCFGQWPADFPQMAWMVHCPVHELAPKKLYRAKKKHVPAGKRAIFIPPIKMVIWRIVYE